MGGFGADEAEQHAELEEPLQAIADDYDAEEALEEEEETATLGGDQFTPEQIAIAEAAFSKAQVSCPAPASCSVPARLVPRQLRRTSFSHIWKGCMHCVRLCWLGKIEEHHQEFRNLPVCLSSHVRAADLTLSRNSW